MDMIKQRDAAVHDYIMKFGKWLHNSDAEPLALHKWAQVHDRFLNRWGIMTSNGFEVLNSVFRIARQLPVCAIVDKTFYKCVDWFVNRQEAAIGWEATRLDFSLNITLVLHRRNEKARKHDIRPMYYGHNNYEVIDKDGLLKTGVRGEVRYDVTFPPEGMPICVCRRPQLTGISCNHVLAVCFLRRLNPNDYVSPYYSLQNYINTWSGRFNGFGNKWDWSLYNGPIIRPNSDKVNKGRRKHK
ncbi:uncharacterized protein LOC144559587 [Carex rostrata]